MVNSLFLCSIALFSLHSHLVISQAASCNAITYGKPRETDCTTLLQKFTEPQVLQSRFFDEEQLRAESDYSWPGIDNPFTIPIVQVPKYYSMNTCNFAIMPYTNPLSRLTSPLGITSWGSIKTRGLQLIADCLKQGSSSGGEIFVKDNTTKHPVLVIFMWASAASFEAKLNQYENDPSYSVQLSQTIAGELRVNNTNGAHMGDGAASKTSSAMTAGLALPSSIGENMDSSVNSF